MGKDGIGGRKAMGWRPLRSPTTDHGRCFRDAWPSKATHVTRHGRSGSPGRLDGARSEASRGLPEHFAKCRNDSAPAKELATHNELMLNVSRYSADPQPAWAV